ncbi:MAG: DUF4367 domain-containing protein, partial [Cellulosilyticum sp.]|nr:DUF4367 domain-containing protein [Cellulosilyticum sp.]
SGENVIYMQQRMACEEAGYETGTTDKIIEVDINGVKGLMYDDSLHWETEDAIYSITSMNEGVTREEMIKIAQSIK